jgi:hypothetical protein
MPIGTGAQMTDNYAPACWAVKVHLSRWHGHAFAAASPRTAHEQTAQHDAVHLRCQVPADKKGQASWVEVTGMIMLYMLATGYCSLLSKEHS